MNGKTNREVLGMIYDELRDHRSEIKDIKNILIEGGGKIAANKANIRNLWRITMGLLGGFGAGFLYIINKLR